MFLPLSHFGGDEEIRTLDPLLAGQVLSQLSYTPRGFFPLRTLKIEQRMTFVLFLNSTLLPRVVRNTVFVSYLDSPHVPMCPVISGSLGLSDLGELSP